MRGWLSWGIAAVFILYLFLLQASTSVMIPELMDAFKINVATVGLLSASYFYSYIVLQMPAGCVVDRLGARLVLSISMLACALVCWLFATTHSLHIAELSRVLMGVFTASGVVGAFYLAANWFPPRHFALLVGLSEMLGMLGGALGQALLALGVKYIGWRYTMEICAGVGVVLGLLTIGLMRNRPDQPASPIACSKLVNSSMLEEFWQVLKLPQAWVNGIFCGLVFAILTGFAALWAVPYLTKLYHINLTTAATASSMVFWGAALGSPLTGWVSHYFSNKRSLMLISTIIALIICSVIFYIPHVPLASMFVLLFLLGFACGIYVLSFAIVCDIVPMGLRCTAMGFTNMMCILLGAPLLQPLIGWILKLQQTNVITNLADFSVYHYQVALSVLIIGLVLAIISIFFIDNPHLGKEKSQRKDGAFSSGLPPT